MSVAAPPPVTPPSLDELEALIREARTRQRKRKSIAATSVVGAVSIGLGLWAGLRGGSGLPPVDRGPNATLIRTRSVGASHPRGPIYQVGSSGGVTWTIGLYRMWLTTDQGRKWRVVPLRAAHVNQPGAQVTQMEFADRKHGWIVTDWVGPARTPERDQYSELGRTSDGGRTWYWSRLNACTPSCGAPHVSFLNARRGFLVNGSTAHGTLFETSDGGATWHPVTRSPTGPITFVDDRDGFLTEVATTTEMSFGRLFTTSDGGRSWDSAALPGASEQVYPGAPTVFGRTVIVVAGGITDGIYVSRNGGNDWTLRQVPPHSYGGLAFSLASATTWLVGAGKRMWLTSDAGRSWRFVPMHDVAKSPNANLFQLDFSSRHSGWALFGNTLYRTVDGGVHWRRAEPHWVVVKQVGGVVKRVRS